MRSWKGRDLMLWKRNRVPQPLPRFAIGYVDSGVTRKAADWLAQLELCEPIAILADTPQNILWLCQRTKPVVLLLEARPDAIERLDAPDKDISGRCELAARLTEVLPECRVYVTCADEFRHVEPVLQMAVEKQLIDGYHFGTLTYQLIRDWLFPP